MRHITFRQLLAVAPFVVLGACATIRTGADFDSGLRLEQYRTFDWGPGDSLPIGDPRLENNPFFDSRVRAAVELELAAKGLKRATTSPDLLVHYHANVRHRVDVIRADEARGYADGSAPRTETVLDYEEGTLVVDVAAAGAKRILWRGWSQTDVGGLLDNPRAMEKQVQKSVRMMMRDFPRTP